MSKKCLRCGEPIVNRRGEAKYCSDRCSKLYLKSQWRKRNREQQTEYHREYRRAKNGGARPPASPSKLREDRCLHCGTTEDLQLAHIKPLWAGGIHKYVITLCRKHHHEFDDLLRDFWRTSIPLDGEPSHPDRRLPQAHAWDENEPLVIIAPDGKVEAIPLELIPPIRHDDPRDKYKLPDGMKSVIPTTNTKPTAT